MERREKAKIDLALFPGHRAERKDGNVGNATFASGSPSEGSAGRWPSETANIEIIAEYLSRQPVTSLAFLLEELERRIIAAALTRTKGNQRAAAARLGMKYTTLNEKVKRHGIEIERQIRFVA